MNVIRIISAGMGIASAVFLTEARVVAQNVEPLPRIERNEKVIEDGPEGLEMRGPKGVVRVKKISREDSDSGDVLTREGEQDDPSADGRKREGNKEKKIIVRPGQRVEIQEDGEAPGHGEGEVIIRRGPRDVREFRWETKPFNRQNFLRGPNPPGNFQFEESPRSHLEAAIRHLHGAGMHEEAERLEKDLKKMRAEDKLEARGPEREELGKLKGELDRVKRELNQLRQQMEKLSDHEGKPGK